MLGLKLNHVDKRGPWCVSYNVLPNLHRVSWMCWTKYWRRAVQVSVCGGMEPRVGVEHPGRLAGWRTGRNLFGQPFRLYTTIENPSYFFMTLSCTEAIQSFISHFNQYSLVDPSWGNIPSWVWQGVSHWFRKLRRRVWHHCHFGNWISWK